MNYLLNELLNNRKATLTSLHQHIQKTLKTMPQGSLRITHKNSIPRYYLYQKKNACDLHRTGKYIRRENFDLVKQLAQKDYLVKLDLAVLTQLDFLQQKIPILDDSIFCNIFNQLSSDRRKLITPLFDSDQDYASRWADCDYKKRVFAQGAPEIYTERGERVLSKSEKILADKFYLMQIPYFYEKPLILQNQHLLHPDFTLLNIRTRKEYIWEHFGMIDDPKYAARAVSRINNYIKNGYIPGINLILTFETNNIPLDMRVVDEMIRCYLL